MIQFVKFEHTALGLCAIFYDVVSKNELCLEDSSLEARIKNLRGKQDTSVEEAALVELRFRSHHEN